MPHAPKPRSSPARAERSTSRASHVPSSPSRRYAASMTETRSPREMAVMLRTLRYHAGPCYCGANRDGPAARAPRSVHPVGAPHRRDHVDRQLDAVQLARSQPREARRRRRTRISRARSGCSTAGRSTTSRRSCFGRTRCRRRSTGSSGRTSRRGRAAFCSSSSSTTWAAARSWSIPRCARSAPRRDLDQPDVHRRVVALLRPRVDLAARRRSRSSPRRSRSSTGLRGVRAHARSSAGARRTSTSASCSAR